MTPIACELDLTLQCEYPILLSVAWRNRDFEQPTQSGGFSRSSLRHQANTSRPLSPLPSLSPLFPSGLQAHISSQDAANAKQIEIHYIMNCATLGKCQSPKTSNSFTMSYNLCLCTLCDINSCYALCTLTSRECQTESLVLVTSTVTNAHVIRALVREIQSKDTHVETVGIF
jgi:hypothetical protein